MQLYRSRLLAAKVAAIALGLMVTAQAQTFTGRVGASHDGNQHDYDDIGAAAWDIGIFAVAGANLVHIDYANHLADNSVEMEGRQRASVEGSAQRWYGSTAMCYNDQTNLQGAIANIAAEINKSTATDRFYLLCAGPMEVAWRGINASDAAKRQYCTAISHSGWNDSHTSSQMSHTWSSIQSSGVNAVHVGDQNDNLNCMTNSCWDWAKNSSDERLRFMHARMVQGVFGDISDAGMAWYVVTASGDQECTPAKLQAFFEGVPPPPPTAVAIPGTIEAEHYTAQSGVQVETTSDAGGGANIGTIENGDYVEYLVNVSAADSFVVTYRAASQTTGGTIELRSGTTLRASTTVAGTGGWQIWQSVTAKIALAAGEQTLRLTFVGASTSFLNLNKIQLASTTPPPPFAGPVFLEANGMVVVEAESVADEGFWNIPSASDMTSRYTGYTGTTTYLYDGNSEAGTDGIGSCLTYRIRITNPGTYTLHMRAMAWQTNGDQGSANDCYIQMVGQSGVEGEPYKWFIKGYVQHQWAWISGTCIEITHGNWKKPEYNLTTGEHEFKVYGRSKNFAFDRFVIAKTNISDAEAQNTALPQSPVNSTVLRLKPSMKPAPMSTSMFKSGRAELYGIDGRRIAGSGTTRAIGNPALAKGIYVIRARGATGAIVVE